MVRFRGNEVIVTEKSRPGVAFEGPSLGTEAVHIYKSQILPAHLKRICSFGLSYAK